MAHFYVSTENSRGNAVTASGTKRGQRTHARGWQSGVEIVASVDAAGDVLDVYMTGGSGGTGHKRHLGTVTMRDGVPTWEPNMAEPYPSGLGVSDVIEQLESCSAVDARLVTRRF